MFDTLVDQLDKKGYNVTSKNEVDITSQDTATQDLVISFGGDNTFLKTASKIRDPEVTAVLPINTQPKHQLGKLCTFSLNYATAKEQMKMLIECLEKSGKQDESDYIDTCNR